MLSFLPAIILFPLQLLLQVANLALWGSLVIIFGLFKLLLPIAIIRRGLSHCMNGFLSLFGVCSVRIIRLCNKVEWDCQVEGKLSKNDWYLMVPNHLSWLDIVLLVDFAAGKIPAPKFFLKKELIWMPFVGLAAWALDMPFMRRYSQDFLNKHPHLKGKDIETTQKSCEKFQHNPTTVINFVEGTRFTEQKRQQKGGTHENLLPPKAGGIAFTLATMGKLFTNILDVTILYPHNTETPVLDMLSGRLNKVIVRVKVLPVSEKVIGDYYNDEQFRSGFQQWLNSLWERKDKLIGQLINGRQ